MRQTPTRIKFQARENEKRMSSRNSLNHKKETGLVTLKGKKHIFGSHADGSQGHVQIIPDVES